jgi:hypothetical protein
MVRHACRRHVLSTWEADIGKSVLEVSLDKVSRKPYLKNQLKTIISTNERVGGMAQVTQHFPGRREDLGSIPSTAKKKKKKRRKVNWDMPNILSINYIKSKKSHHFGRC